MPNKTTILADPVHGFIKIPPKIIQSLLESREVQRLRRIKQLGMGYLVFPAAEHSRFSHAFGAMGLLSNALDSLESKGTEISEKERLAAMAAILLHDIGHGPYSHTLESELIHNTQHEEISKALIGRLQSQIDSPDSPLDITLEMLENGYKRPFFHALISGQLDMDRLDYLSRDSHFTGVAEGRIGVDRILRTLCVYTNKDNGKESLAIESKGIYAVENMLIARRLMYRQVYLHKTVIAADSVLLSAIHRARDLIRDNVDNAVCGTSPTLHWFLKENPDKDSLSDNRVLDHFLNLDDSEVLFSLKNWCASNDRILADLSQRFITRTLFRCTFLDDEPNDRIKEGWRERITHFLRKKKITDPDAHSYYLTVGKSGYADYENNHDEVCVLTPRGNLSSLDKHTDGDAISALTRFVKKPYVCYPKTVELGL